MKSSRNKEVKNVKLVSGGVDSYILSQEVEGMNLFINFGQKYANEELAALKKLGVDFEVITLPPIPPTDEIFIPSRNLMLATIAVIYYNADNVFLACLADGDPTMLDIQKEGLEEMSNILSKFSNREIKVSSPYFELTKNQLVGKFNDKEKLKDTFSCYFPVDGKPCGDCKGCLTRNIALETNGIKSNVELSERMKKEFDKIIENYK